MIERDFCHTSVSKGENNWRQGWTGKQGAEYRADIR